MKSKVSAVEIQMKELLRGGEDIIDDSYLTTQDARRVLDMGGKMLQKCEELRESRDRAITRRDIAEKEFKTLNAEKANLEGKN